MNKLLILLILVATSLKCTGDKEGDIRFSTIYLRLSNVSAFNYENIIVNTSTGNVSFENLNSGQTSEYQAFEVAYRYAFIELEIDGSTCTLQPIDYVGETPLKKGSYTYQIDANELLDRFQRLSLTLIAD